MEPLTLEPQDTEDEQFGTWIGELRKFFEKTQSPVERRFHFTRRVQISDESIDSFRSGLLEIAAKFQFLPAELQSRLIDQFINGVTDRSLQCKLLQEPPGSLDEAILIGRRYEAAKSAQSTIVENQKLIQSVKSVQQVNTSNRICFTCKQQGHTSRDCPNKQGLIGSFTQSAPLSGRGQPPTCYLCNKVSHIARFAQENSKGHIGISPSRILIIVSHNVVILMIMSIAELRITSLL